MGERAGGASFSAACPDSSSVWCRQFSYDNLSNRVVPGSTNVQSTPWDVATFNSNNQITDSGWGYDLNGNITQSPASPQRIVYDAENRMVSFCSSQDGHGNCTALMQYVYDGLGNRVQRMSTGAGTVATTYTYDAFGDLAAEYGGNPVASAGTTEYLTADALGSTRLVMAGSKFERHDYQPFGYEIPYNYPSNNWRTSVARYGVDTVRQKFTGQERDSESSLDFFQARYFAGAQGRFASPDPSNAGANPMDPQSWNGYAYVSNNPLMYTDPSGQGIFGDIGSIVGSFFPGVGTLAGWLLGTVGDVVTGQPISPPGGLGLFLGSLIPTPGVLDPSLGGLHGMIWGNYNPLIFDQRPANQAETIPIEMTLVRDGIDIPPDPHSAYNIQRAFVHTFFRALNPLKNTCGGGGFVYFGGEEKLKLGPFHGDFEAIGLFEYDTKEGGAHGGLLGVGGGPLLFGFESMRRWRTWKAESSPIGLGGGEFNVPKKVGLKLRNIEQIDFGGFVQPASIGGYIGTANLGFGAYVNLSPGGCHE